MKRTVQKIDIDAAPVSVDGIFILTPALLRRARMAVGWRVNDLSAASKVPVPTIYAHEKRRQSGRMHRLTNAAIYEALRKAGVAFQRRRWAKGKSNGRQTVSVA